ncbi:hypothetical protein P9112_010549 [Eukaryota sp. TZLM1-RC]
MCKSYRVDSFLEPLLSKLILDDPNIDSTCYNRASMGLTRGDLVATGLNGSLTILDAMSTDPCNSSNEHFINSNINSPLLAGEKYKNAKYAKPISSNNENSYAQYILCPFVFSLLESSGKAANFPNLWQLIVLKWGMQVLRMQNFNCVLFLVDQENVLKKAMVYPQMLQKKNVAVHLYGYGVLHHTFNKG